MDAVEKHDEIGSDRAHECAEDEAVHPVRRSADWFALAEQLVRWEDDVTAEEIALTLRLYERAAITASAELGLPPVVLEPSTIYIPALLQARHRASRLVATAAREHSKPWSRMPWRRAAVVFCVTLAAFGFFARDAIVDYFDLYDVSRGKPWSASSALPTETVKGTLGEFDKHFFFHTQRESSPWFEIDFEAPTPLQRATIVNRDDCCRARALPLAIEVSRDHQTWTQVAVANQAFRVWRPHLNMPNARWVRLHVLRDTAFHLKAVIFRSK